MIRRSLTYALALAAAIVSGGSLTGAAAGEADTAFADVHETYGTIPGFFRLFPEDGFAAFWHAFRTLELNPNIATDAKTRELISLAVASQGGTCGSCVYFHAAAALANGASKQEIREAVGIGAATSRLDVFFVDAGANIERFQRETDLVLWGDARTIAERGSTTVETNGSLCAPQELTCD